MSLPPVPAGYQSWNEAIEALGAIESVAQGITLQEGKASVKLSLVAQPARQSVGTPSYRDYHVFTDWASRQVIPQPNPDPDTPVAPGRPWRL